MDVIIPVPIPDKTRTEDDDIPRLETSSPPFLPMDPVTPDSLIEDDCDNDFPSLSSGTLLALQEFRTEQSALAERFESLRIPHPPPSTNSPTSIPGNPPNQPLDIDIRTIPENWALSQFWYSNATAVTFANALLHDATNSTHIACVCAPSVFVQLKNILSSPPYINSPRTNPRICLLEYDQRFEVLASAVAEGQIAEGEAEFVRYNFEEPVRRLPAWLQGWADRIVVDPPFLSEACQTAVGGTARWLLDASSHSTSKGGAERGSKNSETPRIIVCTGAIMEDLVLSLYAEAGGGVQMRRTTFEAVHEGGRLSNEWGTFANFECESWRFLDE